MIRALIQSVARHIMVAVAMGMGLAASSHADVTIQIEAAQPIGDFTFPTIPPPAINDAAAGSKWSLVRGQADSNAGSLSVLSDGKLPRSDDSPVENFFFAAATDGGSMIVDLGAPQDVTHIVTYSRHTSTRTAQVFNLFTATGDEAGFSTTTIDFQVPGSAGWKLLAKVNTRSLGMRSSQHAAAISDSQGTLVRARYLRFDVSATEVRDAFGNTFFSEIDIVTADGPAIKRVEVPQRKLLAFASADQRYQFTIDTTLAPELHEWSNSALKPVIQQWYGKIVDMLPSDNFQAPQQVLFQFLPAETMRGTPAWAQNGTISMNAGWFRGELEREARGAVVHEMVHVVQDYQRAAGGRGGAPGWIVEGIPDYVRWFLYEPQSKGAQLSQAAKARVQHNDSYRTSANFIDWVIRTHDQRGDLLRKLNAAAREGKYSSDNWRQLTGKTEEELAKAWKSQ